MKILLDENTSQKLASHLSDHDVSHVIGLGWRGTKNGRLVARAAENGFEVFVTVDKNLAHQQNVKGLPFAVVVLDIHPNRVDTQEACVPNLKEILQKAESGKVYIIEGPHSRKQRPPTF